MLRCTGVLVPWYDTYDTTMKHTHTYCMYSSTSTRYQVHIIRTCKTRSSTAAVLLHEHSCTRIIELTSLPLALLIERDNSINRKGQWLTNIMRDKGLITDYCTDYFCLSVRFTSYEGYVIIVFVSRLVSRTAVRRVSTNFSKDFVHQVHELPYVQQYSYECQPGSYVLYE